MTIFVPDALSQPWHQDCLPVPPGYLAGTGPSVSTGDGNQAERPSYPGGPCLPCLPRGAFGAALLEERHILGVGHQGRSVCTTALLMGVCNEMQ